MTRQARRPLSDLQALKFHVDFISEHCRKHPTFSDGAKPKTQKIFQDRSYLFNREHLVFQLPTTKLHRSRLTFVKLTPMST
jgi:hypothetical protein